MNTATTTGRALNILLREAFYGSQQWSWFLNAGDTGMMGLMRSLTAEDASTPPGPYRSTIAAHAQHILYHLQLIGKVLDGEENPFATANWALAWDHQNVNDEEWAALVDKLQAAADRWIAAVDQIDEGNEMMFIGSIASAVHFAYHLGAMRQMLLSIRSHQHGTV